MSRFAILEKIQQLDPEKDCQEIVFLSGLYEYPWLMIRALEFAMFRTFAVPHTSRILDESGEFRQRAQKRYDDTTLLLTEIVQHGYDSERGKAAIERMNEIHGRFKIANQDFLYVLSTFVLEPIRWHDKYSWRTPTEPEKQANYFFWREIGKRMGLRNIPDSLEELEQFNIETEQTQFQYNSVNYKVAEPTMKLYLSWYPAPLRPLIRQVLYSFMDKPLRDAFGYPKANAVISALADFGLRMMGKAMRYMPARRKPYLHTERRNRTYPDGYQIEELGPPA